MSHAAGDAAVCPFGGGSKQLRASRRDCPCAALSAQHPRTQRNASAVGLAAQAAEPYIWVIGVVRTTGSEQCGSRPGGLRTGAQGEQWVRATAPPDTMG
jgi:hypothetical protein